MVTRRGRVGENKEGKLCQIPGDERDIALGGKLTIEYTVV